MNPGQGLARLSSLARTRSPWTSLVTEIDEWTRSAKTAWNGTSLASSETWQCVFAHGGWQPSRALVNGCDELNTFRLPASDQFIPYPSHKFARHEQVCATRDFDKSWSGG
jgi:hypothetical protein